jgi:hypothetical protein
MDYLEDNLPDHRLPDKLDKIKAYLMDPENNKLESRLMDSLKNYKMVLNYMLDHQNETTGNIGLNSPKKAIEYLENLLGYSYPQSCRIVRETLQLYGDIFKYDKESLRYFHYERLLRLSAEAQKDGDWKAARAIEKEAIELMDLKNFENFDKKQILQFFQIHINRTTNPEALKGSIDITPPQDEA